jgi:phosphate acetyltransferase
MNSFYISSLQNNCGTISISLGLMELLKSRYHKVVFFKPIIYNDDTDIELMTEHFNLSISKVQSYIFTSSEVEELVYRNKTNEIIEKIIERYNLLKQSYDFVFIQGLNKEMITASLGQDINILIAKNLSIPYISVINGFEKSNTLIQEEINIEARSLKKEGIEQFASFVNKIDAVQINPLNELLLKDKLSSPVYPLPYIREVDNITMNDVFEKLDCELLYGKKRFLNQQIYDIKVASMTLDNFLGYINHQDLIIVSGDRSDIIAGTVLSLKSKGSKKIAGMLLTGNIRPKELMNEILCGIDDFPIAVLSTQTATHETVVNVDKIKPKITAKSYTKISLILGAFSKYIDKDAITNKLKNINHQITTPLMFEYKLVNIARQDKQHIVLPESGDDRILRAAEFLLHRDIVDITLLGEESEVKNKADILGLDISKANIIDPKNSKLTKKFAKEFFELRKHKGLTKEAADETMHENVNFFATMMVQKGLADGMVSGASHTTADTVRPALQIIKTLPGVDIVSSVFFMCLDTKVLVYGDCAINQSPDEHQLAQIAISSAKTARAFGIEPKVAMLSYSTGDSGSGEDVQKVVQATGIIKNSNIDFQIEGPIQYDAAIDKNVAAKKLPHSKVAGAANVLIFPDLNTGNNTYKAVQRSSGAVAIGPILQGLNKPVNDLSRGCTVKDIVNTVIITAIQAQKKD